MTKRYLALAALLAASLPAQAGTLLPYEGASVDLGDLHGVAYYVERPDGFRVVATLAEGETGRPVRFEATLADEQTLTISVPRAEGEPALSLELSRSGDRLLVEQGPKPDML